MTSKNAYPHFLSGKKRLFVSSHQGISLDIIHTCSSKQTLSELQP